MGTIGGKDKKQHNDLEKLLADNGKKSFIRDKKSSADKKLRTEKQTFELLQQHWQMPDRNEVAQDQIDQKADLELAQGQIVEKLCLRKVATLLEAEQTLLKTQKSRYQPPSAVFRFELQLRQTKRVDQAASQLACYKRKSSKQSKSYIGCNAGRIGKRSNTNLQLQADLQVKILAALSARNWSNNSARNCGSTN